MAFAIELSPRARDHVRQLRKREQRIIVDAITLHLAHQPDLPTQHRKKLQDNPLAPWKLRVGDYRVFYDVSHESGTVIIVAVGRKDHNRLWIGSEEIDL
jgi:mRNA-degrading endonuclease RelE of RelBE toxin-antitoxin system